MSDADKLRREMVAGLTERGELAPEWREAFEQVPRHAFIPDRVWVHYEDADGPDLVPLDREGNPDQWLATSYANESVITQVDDGRPDEQGRGREVTSSASMPAVVAEMLTALHVEPGMRVLEIGTGTGYNTALLAQRLGPGSVTSIEVDPAVAEHARHRLAEQGFGDVVVVTGDGAHGWPLTAPYDRVLATVAARRIPYAWIAQTRPGGLVVVPWGTAWYPSALLRLEVDVDHVGHGRIVGPASFMLLRDQRVSRWVSHLFDTGEPARSTTGLHPWDVASPEQFDAATTVGLRVPGCRQWFDGTGLRLVDANSGSWATVTITDAPPYPVEQAGTRTLWDEVEAAFGWWAGRGKPGADAWLVTVDQDGQRVELG